VLGNGTDAGFWSGAEAAPRRHLLFAGRLVREKGWATFLDIVAALPPDVTAALAGDGPDRRAVEQAVRTRGLGDRLAVLGRLDRAALRDEYAGSI
jgi:glycosyltransferase involved in cell wall biosynthesis